MCVFCIEYRCCDEEILFSRILPCTPWDTYTGERKFGRQITGSTSMQRPLDLGVKGLAPGPKGIPAGNLPIMNMESRPAEPCAEGLTAPPPKKHYLGLFLKCIQDERVHGEVRWGGCWPSCLVGHLVCLWPALGSSSVPGIVRHPSPHPLQPRPEAQVSSRCLRFPHQAVLRD